MPKLTGIDIIRIAREQGYEGKFIILSGYSDFAYAQAAIRYGVDFYLTKPIDEDELLTSIQTIKQNLEEARLRQNHIEIYRTKAKDVILHEIITGTYHADGKDALSEEDFAKMELDADIYQVVIYENSELSRKIPATVLQNFSTLQTKGIIPLNILRRTTKMSFS